MVAEPSAKDRAWVIFDRIVERASTLDLVNNPWYLEYDGRLRYRPDFATLEKLLAVPLYLKAETRTGVPALALDVWLSMELRRAGFDADATWPRATHPRILPGPIASLLKAVPAKERALLETRLKKSSAVAGVTSASASILGKNYHKQVDVIMTDWSTGPELLISTKRMDSSYGKNAANRVEESYGDAKNLRLRHPLAALGFVFALRSDILLKEPDTAEWLVDLLVKLGREDDAYDATCLVMVEYDDTAAVSGDLGEDSEDPLVAAGLETDGSAGEDVAFVPLNDVETALANLPRVTLRHDAVPDILGASRFLQEMIFRVLDATPVTMHRSARRRRADARRE